MEGAQRGREQAEGGAVTNEEAIRYRTAAHEAGHAVAAFCLNIPVEKVGIDHNGHGLTKTETRRVIAGDPNASFDCAIGLLAGGAYERSLGLEARGDNGDFAKAVVLLQETFESKAAARRGFDVVLEATHALVESDRFQTLCARLTPVLAEKGWHWGPDVEKFLEEHDPEPLEHHSRYCHCADCLGR